MQIHQIKSPNKGQSTKRVGRGGKRGTYSGKGQKGQKSRAGGRIRPQMRDIIKKIPKKRGYRFSPVSEKPIVINIDVLNNAYKDGETVSIKTLKEKKIVPQKNAKFFHVKILGSGALHKKIIVSGCALSGSARKAVEQSGGSVV